MALTKQRLMTVPQRETKPTGPDFYARPGRKDVTVAPARKSPLMMRIIVPDQMVPLLQDM
jgi:hypothetical protein